METHFSEAEKLYTEFVTGGCDRTVLERADEALLLSLAEHLEEADLWKMMGVAMPIRDTPKEHIVDSISRVTIAALNGERFIADEIEYIQRTKVVHPHKFRLREAELEDLKEDGNRGRQTFQTTEKNFHMRMHSWKRKVVPHISKEQLEAGWLPVSDFLWKHLHQKMTPENIRSVSLLLKTLFVKGSHFDIDGKRYAAEELFGYFLNAKEYSYYINPVATQLINDTLELAPVFPADEKYQNWLSATDVADKIFGRATASNIAHVNSLAKKMLKTPEQEIDVGTAEHPHPVFTKDVIKIFRQAGQPPRHYFDPGIVAYIKDRLGVFEALPEQCKHYISEEMLAKQAQLGMNVARAGIWHISDLLRKQTALNSENEAYIDPDSLAARMIEVAAYNQTARICLEPTLARDRFSPQEIRDAALHYYEETDMLPPPPEGWLALGEVYKRFSGGSRDKPENATKEKEVLLEWVKALHQQKNPDVGYFMSPGNNAKPAYYVNPEIVGPDKLINGAELRRRAGTEEAPSKVPEGWIRSTTAKQRIGVKGDEIAAMNEWMKRLNEQKHPAVGLFAVGRHTNYFLDPEQVGHKKFISRQSVLKFMEQLKAESWKPPAKSAALGE